MGRWNEWRDLFKFVRLCKDPDPMLPSGRCAEDEPTGPPCFTPVVSCYKLLHPSLAYPPFIFLSLRVQPSLSGSCGAVVVEKVNETALCFGWSA